MSIDVENLIGRTPLSADTYRTFRNSDALRETASADESHETRQEFVAGKFHPVAEMPMTAPEIVMERVVAPPPPPAEPKPESRTRTSLNKVRFGALRSVMMGETSSATRKSGAPKNGPTIKVIGAGGGTGVTTILATLARTLSKNGQCAVVVESDLDSILFFHFGLTEKRDTPGLQIAPTFGGHPIFLLQRPQLHVEGENWIEQSLTPLESTGYRILLDGSVEGDAAQFGDVLNLVVLTPDLGSVHRLDNILRTLDGQPALFVLNKFDATIGLHEQVRDWMLHRIGDRLVTIGRTDAIAESLAEGTTILDHAATSPVAADFQNLLNVICSWEQPELSSVITKAGVGA